MCHMVVGIYLHEQFSHFIVAIGTGIVERNKTTFVFGMDVSTMLDEHFNYPHTIVASSQVEGSRLWTQVCVHVK